MWYLIVGKWEGKNQHKFQFEKALLFTLLRNRKGGENIGFYWTGNDSYLL